MCHADRFSSQLLALLLVPTGLAGACAAHSAQEAPAQQAQLAQAVSSPARSGPPQYLSEVARGVLKSRMASHTRDMSELVSAIMILDYPRIEVDGTRIAEDVSLSRPLTNDATELNAAFPEMFFLRQDDLRTQARTLAGAAHALDAYRVAAAYGRVSEACVRCHADFRPKT
jgi:cytochrome c556